MHCSPQIGPPHRSMDDKPGSIPASATRRGPGSKTRCLAVGGFPVRAVTGRSQQSRYKRVRVVYVIRPLGRCWRCSACLFLPSFPPIVRLLFVCIHRTGVLS